MNFNSKNIVITGGALGIGRCLIQEFAKAGANVFFIDNNPQEGNYLEQDLLNSGLSAKFFYGDISDEKTLDRFSEFVIKSVGTVDCLVNNACITKKGILSGCSYEDFSYVLKIGVTASYYLCKLFLPYFSKGASVCNISSTRANMSQPDTESYTAAKGAISALTRALAVSLSGKVRVNSVSPGWIDTGDFYNKDYIPCYEKADQAQHPSNRVGNPYDIARAVMFLCSEENSFITGEDITVDGGMSKLMIYSDDCGWTYNPYYKEDIN